MRVGRDYLRKEIAQATNRRLQNGEGTKVRRVPRSVCTALAGKESSLKWTLRGEEKQALSATALPLEMKEILSLLKW